MERANQYRAAQVLAQRQERPHGVQVQAQEVGYNEMPVSSVSRVNRAAFKMMKTMKTFVGSTVLENDCPICFVNFEPG